MIPQLEGTWRKQGSVFETSHVYTGRNGAHVMIGDEEYIVTSSQNHLGKTFVNVKAVAQEAYSTPPPNVVEDDEDDSLLDTALGVAAAVEIAADILSSDSSSSSSSDDSWGGGGGDFGGGGASSDW